MDIAFHDVVPVKSDLRLQSLHSDYSQGADAYRQATPLAVDHADAYVSLGAMLCDASRSEEATALFDAALAAIPACAVLHFNRVIALADQAQLHDSLQAYEQCLALDAAFSDAHYNAALLCDKLRLPQATLRHYNAYRRLQ